MFGVSEAYYLNSKTDQLVTIAGVPGYDMDYYGEYTGNYPYQAASKAFTGLQKHMKKFHGQRKSKPWFPGYDPENPPDIVFKMVEINDDDDIVDEDWYIGKRVPARQGRRVIVNSTDGRIREYKWESKVRKFEV